MACPTSILFLESVITDFPNSVFEAKYQDFRFCSGQGCMCVCLLLPCGHGPLVAKYVKLHSFLFISPGVFLVHLHALIKLELPNTCT